MDPIDWQKLTKMAGTTALEIERVRLVDWGVAVEGRFSLPPLAKLAGEDQIFIAAFVRSHGSIKEMERLFGVSYPTIKNRLNRLAGLLPLEEIEPAVDSAPRPTASDLLGQLERGERTASDVLAALKHNKTEKE